MQRFSRVWTRSQRALVQRVQPTLSRPSWALKRGVVAVGGHPQRALQLPQVRHFQSTSVVLQREDDEEKMGAAPTDNDSDGELEEGSDEEDELKEYDEEEEEEGEEEEDEDVDAEIDEEAAAMAAEYIGVKYSPGKVKKYSAELALDDLVISGGDFWTALDAAKGYDELVDLYCDLDTPRNFPAGSQDAETAAGSAAASTDFAASGEGEWEVPEVGKRNADIIPPIRGEYLKLDEVLEALERERAIDVYTVNLAGKSSLADYMIFTTGRSQAHMRRMADMMIQSMKARDLKDEFEYAVEGRDCDDWMIADCSNIVVHFMREDTRRILNLEDHWENMENDKHKVYGDMTEDEYMDRFGTSELMEYLEDDDFTSVDETEEGASGSNAGRGGKGDDVDWK